MITDEELEKLAEAYCKMRHLIWVPTDKTRPSHCTWDKAVFSPRRPEPNVPAHKGFFGLPPEPARDFVNRDYVWAHPTFEAYMYRHMDYTDPSELSW